MIGDNVTLVVRLRRSGGSDAMVSGCRARAGGGGGDSGRGGVLLPPKQELTDYRQGQLYID